MMRFDELVGKFEGELGRNLYSKERDLVSWMVDQQSQHHQTKKGNHNEQLKTLLL